MLDEYDTWCSGRGGELPLVLGRGPPVGKEGLEGIAFCFFVLEVGTDKLEEFSKDTGCFIYPD